MVAVVGPAVRLIVCPEAAVAKERIASTRAAIFKIFLNWFVSIVRYLFFSPFVGRARLTAYRVSSITNSRVSTSIIISIPPGKTLLVVISRSLCECHMNAQPRSLAGFNCRLAGLRLVQFAVLTAGVPAPPLGVVGFGVP